MTIESVKPKAKKLEESMKAIVWSETQRKPKSFKEDEWSKWSPDKRVSWYLSNFYRKLPTEIARDAFEHWGIKHTGDTSLAKAMAYRKRKWGEGYKSDEKERTANRFSKKRWEETGEQFLASVNTAIAQSGVDRQKLLEYITAVDDDAHLRVPDTDRTLSLPVYIKLREMGYSHSDLTI